jgi:4-diphosphocytidyl-2-C-methyl-D-erythritol kinase
MIKFPNCKINIGLNILSKRGDGFHNIQTVFYPIPIYDAIEVIESNHSSHPISFSQSGIQIPGSDTTNICIKAYELLQKDFQNLPAMQVHLHKAIPIGAGLGGGSADAAFMLKLLNEKFVLNLTDEQLINYASQLGSDCPFFMLNQPCFATGRGEILEPISLDLSSYHILLVNPGIHVNTGQAFSNIRPGKNNTDLKSLINCRIEDWRQHIINDFEETVFEKHPEIGIIKDALYKKDALYASMSGSGSTVYGIFKKGDRPSFNYPDHYFLRWI